LRKDVKIKQLEAENEQLRLNMRGGQGETSGGPNDGE